MFPRRPRLPVRSGSMVEGGGAGRTGNLSDRHVTSGGAGDIIVGHHWGAHRLQCPVGGVLPAHARGKGGHRVNGADMFISDDLSRTSNRVVCSCRTAILGPDLHF